MFIKTQHESYVSIKNVTEIYVQHDIYRDIYNQRYWRVYITTQNDNRLQWSPNFENEEEAISWMDREVADLENRKKNVCW